MSSIAIYQDNDDVENQGIRKAARKPGLASRAPLQERIVLRNVNGPRVQPSRAVKTQGVVQEKTLQTSEVTKVVETKHEQSKHFVVPSAKSAFAVFEDVLPDPSPRPLSQSVAVRVEDDNCKENIDLEYAKLSHEVGKLEPMTTYSDSPMMMDSWVEDEEMTEQKLLIIDERLDKVISIPEYRKEIYTYLREAEVRYRPKADYMRKQVDITQTMRSILVDWLVEVAEEYKLSSETLCLTVSCIDRFLSVMSVVRGKLQLVGAAAMFIAAKYEEVYPPEVGEFVYITDDTYTMKQVLHMEQLMLKVLSFSITVPTINTFCSELIKEMALSDGVSDLTMYLAELTLLDGEPFLKYVPSQAATSCFCYAAYLVGERFFMPRIKEMTDYCFQDLQECVADLFKAMHRAPTHQQQAIFSKYSQEKLSCVAKMQLPVTIPLEFP